MSKMSSKEAQDTMHWMFQMGGVLERLKGIETGLYTQKEVYEHYYNRYIEYEAELEAIDPIEGKKYSATMRKVFEDE